MLHRLGIFKRRPRSSVGHFTEVVRVSIDLNLEHDLYFFFPHVGCSRTPVFGVPEPQPRSIYGLVVSGLELRLLFSVCSNNFVFEISLILTRLLRLNTSLYRVFWERPVSQDL